jgi:antitoxin (DNA-binding transcriptional repressor) of toxin-antitoxin stability system|nr:type II toxin-antitoxin system Phd/YefM family antitoxin [uncultured Rhodopila sp.]
MAATETITASEFKAKCLNILDRLAGHELERVIITKRGRTVGVLLPPQTLAVQDLFGSMRGSVTIPEGFDLTAPVLDEPLDAEEGIWHRE